MNSSNNFLNRISLNRPKKSKIIVFDKNYNDHLKKLINKDFIVFNINLSELNIFLVIYSIYTYIFFNKIHLSFHDIYIKNYLKRVNPDIVISFDDTDFRFLRLSKIFKMMKFILIQNSYRPQGFYGNLTLKKDDVLITYSPLVRFNICSNEIAMKSFKYCSGNDINESLEDKVIFISQYRQYTNEEFVKLTKEYLSEVDNGLMFENEPDYYIYQNLFLNFLSVFFNKNEKNLFYKSAHREQTSFLKADETGYFMKFNIDELKVTNEDIFKTSSNDIYICLDSTMIFELMSNNKKVIIYPHRKLFLNSSCDPHIEIFNEKFPELVISQDFSDFEFKFNRLDKLSIEEYASEVKIFNSMEDFNLNNYL